MPRDGAGVYSYPSNTTPGPPNTVIGSTKANSRGDDLETDANTPRPVVAGGSGSTNAAVARTNFGLSGVIGLTGVAGVDTITASATPAITSYIDGGVYSLKAFGTNTLTTPTLNVNGVGAKTIVKNDNDPLGMGDIGAATFYLFVFNETADVFELVTLNTDGTVLKSAFTELSSVATGTNQIPFDDTVPQSSEGTEFMSLAITPKSADSVISVSVVLFGSLLLDGEKITMGIFKDSDPNALAVSVLEAQSTSVVGMIVMNFAQGSTGTTEVTYKVRAGPSAAGTVTVNGQSSSRLFGNVPKSFIRIVEYSS